MLGATTLDTLAAPPFHNGYMPKNGPAPAAAAPRAAATLASASAPLRAVATLAFRPVKPVACQPCAQQCGCARSVGLEPAAAEVCRGSGDPLNPGHRSWSQKLVAKGCSLNKA